MAAGQSVFTVETSQSSMHTGEAGLIVVFGKVTVDADITGCTKEGTLETGMVEWGTSL